MAILINASFNKEKITLNKVKDGKWVNLTIAINDEVDQYGNNVVIIESQTKDEKDSKEKKVYLGNGKVVWKNSDSVEVIPNKKKTDDTSGDDTPF